MRKTINLITIVLLAFFINACLEEAESPDVGAHPQAWLQKGSADFHGDVINTESLSLESCQTCHGEDYQGGSSQVSCYESQCHALFPHPEGFVNANSANFHEKVMTVLNWDISTCQPCHGTDFKGAGFESKDCTTCHKGANGPAECNTCHGFIENAAPPVDLRNRSAKSYVTVGLHQVHNNGSTYSTNFLNDCSGCHVNPSAFDSPGHLDDTPNSEVIFEYFSYDNTGMWDREAGTCNNYCHGDFKFKKEDSNNPFAYADSVIAGNNSRVFWQFQKSEPQVYCGSCHGIPPTGHVSNPNCSNCHSKVVDESLNIIDKSLHINGQIDLD